MFDSTPLPSPVTRKIGQNRGKPRLWIEGDFLTQCGFRHGAPWTLVPIHDGFMIVPGKVDGIRTRKIAGTPARPIIDISGATLSAVAHLESVTLTPSALGAIMVCA